jgi:hypothetical protein
MIQASLAPKLGDVLFPEIPEVVEQNNSVPPSDNEMELLYVSNEVVPISI